MPGLRDCVELWGVERAATEIRIADKLSKEIMEKLKGDWRKIPTPIYDRFENLLTPFVKDLAKANNDLNEYLETLP